MDIVNAFNSIPWDRIRRALVKHWVPNTTQGLQPGVSKYTRLQYRISDPRSEFPRS